jgi:hypothetical protein
MDKVTLDRLKAAVSELASVVGGLTADPPSKPVDPPPVVDPPKPTKTVDWTKTGLETQAYYNATGKWIDTIKIYTDGTREGPAIPSKPPVVTPPVVTPPVVTQPGQASGAVNIELRGQSNAYLLKDMGGLAKLGAQVEAATGVKVNLLADFDASDKAATIYSGTAFMNWAKDGQQAGLLAFIAQQPAAVRALPTITVWAHNENDQNSGVSKADWLAAVRADAVLMRQAFGQTPATTPYVFTWIPYAYGKNLAPREGMMDLVADKTFNATFCDAFAKAEMNYGGEKGRSQGQGGPHIGKGDVDGIVAALAAHLTPIVKALAGGTATTPKPDPVPNNPPPTQADVVWSGIDKLSHRYGHVWQHDGMLTVSSWAGDGFKPSGAMQPPKQGGNGYGVYTIDCDGSKTNGPGKFLCIWPEDDVWRWEIDIAENDFQGIAYATIHWDGNTGKDKSKGYPIPGVRLDARHVWECTWARDLIIIKVDGVEKLRITENVPRDKADGGVCNGLLGAGMQPAPYAQAQTGDNVLNVYACSYRKLA